MVTVIDKMPQHVLHNLHVRPCLECQACRGVTQIVQPDRRQSSTTGELLEPGRHIRRAQRAAIRLGEQQADLEPRGAESGPSAGGIGAGDVRLAAVVGLVDGWLGWAHLAAALLTALVLALVLSAVPRPHQRGADGKTLVPFGPCLLAGALGVVLISGGR
ncbi:A24 family peptidase [Amycolatopsis carbonis]|uniref:A24 family peptidase n=1 Tax=Amycolatopsis carbonis TaxID=715471 RepID=A0A9Y2MVG3_9PSEU|nr:A24 family peptidase [Amycolatopsis sp. 2-15]WIX82870.1 A24 family peptidase [Amycolatopsis sp. 2-15]